MYSAIEHLARILSLRDWRSVSIVALTAAIDCSRDKTEQYFVMAGFVSSAERWSEFDSLWRKRLAIDGLEYFHMHRFAHSVKPFDQGWRDNEPRRRALISDLLTIVQSHAWYKSACIFPLASLLRFSDESRRTLMPTLIAAAGRYIWAEIDVWRKRERFPNPVRVVFEDGDDDKGSLIEAMKHVSGHTPSFEFKKDDAEKGIIAFTPLQAADILAYEGQKLTQRYDSPARGIALRFPYQELEKIPGDIRVMREDDATAHDEFFRVVRYFNEHPLKPGPMQ
jgi:hypothetical protein